MPAAVSETADEQLQLQIGVMWAAYRATKQATEERHTQQNEKKVRDIYATRTDRKMQEIATAADAQVSTLAREAEVALPRPRGGVSAGELDSPRQSANQCQAEELQREAESAAAEQEMARKQMHELQLVRGKQFDAAAAAKESRAAGERKLRQLREVAQAAQGRVVAAEQERLVAEEELSQLKRIPSAGGKAAVGPWAAAAASSLSSTEHELEHELESLIDEVEIIKGQIDETAEKRKQWEVMAEQMEAKIPPPPDQVDLQATLVEAARDRLTQEVEAETRESLAAVEEGQKKQVTKEEERVNLAGLSIGAVYKEMGLVSKRKEALKRRLTGQVAEDAVLITKHEAEDASMQQEIADAEEALAGTQLLRDQDMADMQVRRGEERAEAVRLEQVQTDCRKTTEQQKQLGEQLRATRADFEKQMERLMDEDQQLATINLQLDRLRHEREKLETQVLYRARWSTAPSIGMLADCRDKFKWCVHSG